MTHPTNGPTNAPAADGDKKGAADASKCAPQTAPSGAGDKSRAETWNAGGSRSPGSLPEQTPAGDCCDPKSASTGGKDHSHAQPHAAPPAAANPPVVAAAPTQDLGARQDKKDESRPVPTHVATPVAAHVGAQDTKQNGRPDPVQPKRHDPIQPAPVVPPSVGAVSAVGEGDDAN